LGTQPNDSVFRTFYGIVYYPVKEKGNIQAVFDQIDKELIDTALANRKLTFIKSLVDSDDDINLEFKGDDCKKYRLIMGFKPKEICSFIYHSQPQLLKYATRTPSGEKGLYAVIGYETFYFSTSLFLDLDKKYYVFSPVVRSRTQFPFVSNAQRIYPFVKGVESFSIDKLMEIDPWTNKQYGVTLR
jgi:hypothetical protein